MDHLELFELCWKGGTDATQAGTRGDCVNQSKVEEGRAAAGQEVKKLGFGRETARRWDGLNLRAEQLTHPSGHGRARAHDGGRAPDWSAAPGSCLPNPGLPLLAPRRPPPHWPVPGPGPRPTRAPPVGLPTLSNLRTRPEISASDCSLYFVHQYPDFAS